MHFRRHSIAIRMQTVSHSLSKRLECLEDLIKRRSLLQSGTANVSNPVIIIAHDNASMQKKRAYAHTHTQNSKKSKFYRCHNTAMHTWPSQEACALHRHYEPHTHMHTHPPPHLVVVSPAALDQARQGLFTTTWNRRTLEQTGLSDIMKSWRKDSLHPRSQTHLAMPHTIKL